MIQGILSNDPVSGAKSNLPQQELGKDAFMQLLVAQMKNQDPMSPVDNQEYIAQLAQFSSLEEMQVVNENLVALALLQQDNALMAQLTDSSALIGKSVTYLDPQSGEPTTGSVDSVRLQDGLALLRIDGNDVPLQNVTEVLGEDGAPDTDADADGDDGDQEDNQEG